MTEKIALQSVLDPRQVLTGTLRSETPDAYLVVLTDEAISTLFDKNGWKRVTLPRAEADVEERVQDATYADNAQVLHVAAQIAKLNAELLTRLAQEDDKRCDSDDSYERGRVAGYEEALRDFSRSEPTDAEVLAALNAWDTLSETDRDISYFGKAAAIRMATALKAAFLAGQDQGPAANCAYCVGAGGYEEHDGSWVPCTCQYPESRNEQEESK